MRPKPTPEERRRTARRFCQSTMTERQLFDQVDRHFDGFLSTIFAGAKLDKYRAIHKQCQDATIGPGFKGTGEVFEKGGGTC
jgi:hypothetical protein